MKRRSLLIGGASLGLGGLAWRGATGSMASYGAAQSDLRAEPSPKAGLVDLARIAALAPSGHNAQPWLLRFTRNRIDVLPDFSRRSPVVDPDDHHLFVSLGAAAETLSVGGPAFGRPGEATAQPDGSLRYDFTQTSALRRDSSLNAILRRQSVRAGYDGRSPPGLEIDALLRHAALPGVRVVPIADRTRLDGLRDLAAEGVRAQFGDAAFIDELRSWTRFNPREALARGDGLFAAATGAPVAPDPLGRLLFGLATTVGRETDRLARQMDSTPLAAVFFAEEAAPRGWAQVGRSLARFLIAATQRGLKTAHVNQPAEVAALRPALAGLAGEPGLRPDIVLRLGYGPEMAYSPRRPVARILL